MTVALIDEAVFADRIGKDVGEHGQPDGGGPNQKSIAKRDRFVSMQQAERKAGIEERAFSRISARGCSRFVEKEVANDDRRIRAVQIRRR